MFIHRGLIHPNLKENHISSFKVCIQHQFNIETDIHFSQNHTPFCHHDYNLKRLCKIPKPLRTLRDHQLKKYHLTKLSELLTIVTPKTQLLVEIKPRLTPATLERLLTTCHGFHKTVRFISFKKHNLINIRKSTPDFKLGLIFHRHAPVHTIQQALNQNHIQFLVLPASKLSHSKITQIKKKKYFYTIKKIKKRDAKSNYIVENLTDF